MNDTEVIGKWNNTIKNSTQNYTVIVIPKKDGILFVEESKTMYLVSFFTLVTFILMHLYFKCRYKSEHKDMP